MKNFIKILIPAFILTLFFIAIPANAQESSFEKVKDLSPIGISNGEILINQEKNGDLFLAGNNTEITSPVNGNIFFAGEKLSIQAPINGSVYFIGQTIEIRAPISGSVAFLGDKFYMSSLGDVNNDVYGIGANVLMEGRVGRNMNLAYAPNSNITINGKILGTLAYTNTKPNITENASVFETRGLEIPDTDRKEWVLFKVYHSIFLIAIGIFLIKVTPRFFDSFMKNYQKISIRKFFITLASIFVIPLVTILLILSLLGIPIAIFIWLTLTLVAGASLIPAGIYTGEKFFGTNKEKEDYDPKKHRIRNMIIGIILLDLITIIPVVGALLNIVIAYLCLSTFYDLILKSRKNRA